MNEPQNAPGDFRNVKCTLAKAQFDALQWSAKRAGKPPHPAVPLADFMRAAILGKIREVVRGEIARGKAIPPDIAAVLDERRAQATPFFDAKKL